MYLGNDSMLIYQLEDIILTNNWSKWVLSLKIINFFKIILFRHLNLLRTIKFGLSLNNGSLSTSKHGCRLVFIF